MGPSVAVVLGVVVALVGTILSLVLIVPESKRKNLPKFFRFVHDLFNFKFLVLEKVLQVLYILCTLLCIGIGFFMLFAGYESYWSGYESYFPYGLALIVLGPIGVRLAYEGMMLIILLVKNTIAINNKLKDQNADEPKVSVQPTAVVPEAPAATEAPAQPAAAFCTHCGAPLSGDNAFCTACGTPRQ